MSSDALTVVATKLEQARTSRKKGDALRGAGRETLAQSAYHGGVAALSEALTLLLPGGTPLASWTTPLQKEAKPVVEELAEIYGTLGGMYQRLDDVGKAFESYERGAALETRFELPSTYNRLNAVKCQLLAGQAHLRDVEPRLRELASFIDRQLRDKGRQTGTDESDSGWAWADLGDCCALLNDVSRAAHAYATFISKAEIKAPERTLQTLKKISTKLRELQDPDAGRLDVAINVLEHQLLT